MNYDKYMMNVIMLEGQSEEFSEDGYALKGHIKLETGRGKCAVRVAADGIRVRDKGSYIYKLIFFGRKKEKTIHAVVGTVAVNRWGCADTYFRINPANIDGRGNGLDAFSMVIVAAVSTADDKESLHPILKGDLELGFEMGEERFSQVSGKGQDERKRSKTGETRGNCEVDATLESGKVYEARENSETAWQSWECESAGQSRECESAGRGEECESAEQSRECGSDERGEGCESARRSWDYKNAVKSRECGSDGKSEELGRDRNGNQRETGKESEQYRNGKKIKQYESGEESRQYGFGEGSRQYGIGKETDARESIKPDKEKSKEDNFGGGAWKDDRKDDYRDDREDELKDKNENRNIKEYDGAAQESIDEGLAEEKKNEEPWETRQKSTLKKRAYNEYYNLFLKEALERVSKMSRFYDDVQPFIGDKTGAAWKKIVNVSSLPILSQGAHVLTTKYRHYIFGEGQNFYFLGVPGRNVQSEHPESGRSGFTFWQPIAGAERTQGEYGYWICAIEKASGTITEL